MAKLDRVYTDFHPVIIKGTTGDETDELFRIEDKFGNLIHSKNSNDKEFNVMSYGAKGNGTKDDSDAIIATLNAASTVGVGGGKVYFPRPSSHYKVTKPLPLPYAPGLRIVGESKATPIIQYTDNTPIFVIDQNGMHSWEIRDLQLGYNSSQPATNTAACPIYFSGGASAPAESEIYNFKLARLMLNNGYYGIGADAAKYHTVWGMWADDIWFNQGLTGGAINLNSAFSSGRPNINLRNLYVHAQSMAGPIFEIPAAETCLMDGIEINSAWNAPILIREWGNGSWSINSFKIEGGTYNSGASPMFDFAGGTYRFGTLNLSTLTAGASWGLPVIFRDAGGVNTKIRVDELYIGMTVTSNTVYVSRVGGPGSEMIIGRLVRPLPTDIFLTDIGGTTHADYVTVEAWNSGRVSSDKGDADYTVTLGDPNIISYETALTATRTVTLPPMYPFSSSTFNGLKYRVVRSGGGAFALNINDSNGSLINSIPSGKTGAIEYTARSRGWVNTLKALI